ERRRRWPLKEKLAIVAESFESGAVVSHVAQRHGIKPQQLFDWRRQVREHVPRADPLRSVETEAPSFAPVIIAERVPVPPASGKDAPATSIEIAIGIATIRINGPVDTKALRGVLRALKAVS